MTNSDKLLKVLGSDPNAYATNYGVRKAILSALGGNPENCSNINEVDLEILRIYQSGGGGGTGGTIMLETANITKNGTYIPSEGYNGFDKAIVNVVPVLETANITENGTYTPSSNYDGFGSVVVNITNPVDVWVVPNGMKFSYSTFSKIPSNLNFSNVTNFSRMFYECDNLGDSSTVFIDTSKGTDFSYMFYGCDKYTFGVNIPQMDTSNGTNFSYMFSNFGVSTKSSSIPQIDTSNGTNFSYMFNRCSVTKVPSINTSKGTNFSHMFDNCGYVMGFTIPELDTSSGVNFNSMFYSVRDKLTIIPLLNLSNGTDFGNMFYNCTGLQTITLVGSINYNIDFSYSKSLTYESVKSILTACSNTTTPTTSKTLKFSRTLTDQNGELAALVADCNTKGWTISGLTLN